MLGFLFIAPFAIFDAAAVSDNSQVEQVALETPSFDASISNFILLEFDHKYISGSGSSCKIQAYNGTDWFDVITYSNSIPDITHEIVDISTYVGGITNAKLRFVWSGNGSGYWAFDNLSIYGALPVDAGIVYLDNPVTPIIQGTHEVKVTLGNFGYDPLTSAIIKWTANDIAQPDFNWNGNIPFGGTQNDISIGNYDFQGAVQLKIWSEDPNGQGDPNPYNDTITKLIYPALCGIYTIGGTNPDFSTFTEAVNVLHTAGISCAVNFKVRDGEYNEQLQINAIQGSSEQNTITFESENGDSTAVLLTYYGWYQNTVTLNKTKFINIKGIGFRGDFNLNIVDSTSNINIEHCDFTSGRNGIIVSEGSNLIKISNNLLHNEYQDISLNQTNNLVINNNKINIATIADDRVGIHVQNCDSTLIFNNYLFTNTTGPGSGTGIYLGNSYNTRIYFNSMSINNVNIGEKGKCIDLNGGGQNIVKNNIFNIKQSGFPAFIREETQGFTMDYNNYYHPSGLIGQYHGTNYYSLDGWKNATQQDDNSLAENPFNTSDSDLSMNQVLLNNIGTPITGIMSDIDGTIRNETEPDLGAKEYELCQPDAGINWITAPVNPVDQGTQDVKVILQNQGSSTLNSTLINWKVNGELQSPFSWDGNLAVNESTEIIIGNYSFEGGLYSIIAWTSQPNGSYDCNPYNDTTTTSRASYLCGTYTIGGVNPDFANFTDAVSALHNAGVSCAVNFKVRDGEYNEQLQINAIQGSSEQNTITFESENGDSTAVLLTYNGWYQNTVTLSKTKFINIKGIGFRGDFNLNIADSTSNINIEHCDFTLGRYGILVSEGSHLIKISNNLLYNEDHGITLTESHNLEIKNNKIEIATINNGRVGIHVQNCDTTLIYNNYLFTNLTGSGSGTGIYLGNSYNTGIYFNSISINNVNISGEGKCIDLNGGGLNKVKNNIFNITQSGFPAYLREGTQGFSMDYNDYFNSSGMIGQYEGEDYDNLVQWGAAINGDANSKDVPPYFANDSIPLPYQRILNGAGIPVQDILLDINGNIRNDQAPDIGCVEFTVDFGVTDLVSPTLDCFHTEIDSVKVYLRQFGDIPFIDLQLAYQVNNGEIHYDMVPGTIYNDLVFTFSETVNISAEGEYHFKVWLINALDDNINNDTLRTIRYSKPVPILTSSYNNQCTWKEVNFSGSAQIAEPYFIESYEWLFGDGTVSYQQNPSHIYENTGLFDVVFRAYSNAGCYSEEELQVFIDPAYQVLDFGLDILNEVCKGDGTGSVDIMASGGNQPYLYFMNGEPIEGNHVSDIPSGNYTFMVRDAQQCETSKDTVIYPAIFMNPIISAEPDSGFAPLIVDFDFTSIDPDSWIWDFGDGETSTETTLEHTFSTYGEHIIVLTVNSGEPYLCEETDTVKIFVDVSIIIEANTVFTPNNDGLNDYFEVRTTGIRDLNAKIFDQWGDKVYEINDVADKWDGFTESGNEAPEGTYFYYINATGFANTNHERQGSVMLLRDESKVYPNPAKGPIKIKAGGLLNGQINIFIYNLYGDLVLSEVQEMSDEVLIDVSNLPHGIYILKACDAGDCIYEKLIKE